ncbi:MAG: acetylornithine/succinylornithine family transaminase [Eubacteriales bacterium]|nr:acetylornithine/succinylornithine family transaminase [Eubacteriales bacterium]MDD4389394.1 acetylornithine/succinylornithine family transaminase [Eubacteriales bacterium]
MNTKFLDKTYISNTYKRFDVVFTHGSGALLFDDQGKEYIDLSGGIAVNTFGINDEEWVAAVCAQAKKLQHVSNLYFTEPQTKLAEILCSRTGAKKVFFSNSGAEANECMIKAARKYSSVSGNTSNIITLKNSFHGRTITTLSATGQENYHKDFGPFLDGFFHAEANNFSDMETLVESAKPCGIMIELIQGEGGIYVLEKEYVKQLEALCKEKDILLMIDEVQTGNGRTGQLYAFQEYDINPDLVSTAKGLAGGLPMGATLMFEKAENVLGAGDHGSTFGGNPVAAAAAVSVLSRIDDRLLSDVKAKSRYIIDSLNNAEGVCEVSGLGLMLGILPSKAEAKDIVENCLKRGVLLLTAKDRIRLLPPLNIGMNHIKKAMAILKEELAK